MSLPNIFTKTVSEEIINRIIKLTPTTQSGWGKMNVSQMLAHCNVAYEMIYETKHKKPNAILRFILKVFVKNKVVGEAPYKHNSPTAPQFIMKEQKDFEVEKIRLIAYIKKTLQLGETHFDYKVSDSFGVLTKNEWSNMMYKHLNHHLTQFGV